MGVRDFAIGHNHDARLSRQDDVDRMIYDLVKVGVDGDCEGGLWKLRSVTFDI